MKLCYMCNSEATSREHVPPKCLFPEEKDLLKGIKLRKELIKVPSCDIHNTVKSKDDEFLLYALSMNIANNDIAYNLFSTKIMRAYKRRPSLMKKIIADNEEVVAVDNDGIAYNTLMVKADMARINKCLDHIARALYFHEFKAQFYGHCRFLNDFMIKTDSKDTIKINIEDKEKAAIDHVKSYFKKQEHKGKNPSVFRYHFEEPDSRGLIALSLQFFGGTNAFIAFIPNA